MVDAVIEIYKIRKVNDKYEVYNPANEHVFGTHDTEDQAHQQQRALYVSAPPEKEHVTETGVYSVSVAETVPTDASDESFAYVPNENKSDRKLYVGDAQHAALAVQAVTTGLEGNKAQIPGEHSSAVKGKIAGAIRKFYSGAEQKYYLKWLETGKKPDESEKSDSVKEFRLSTPSFAFRGKFPDVPLSSVVDKGALTHGDPGEPLFVVRPLAILNAVSENGLKYDAELIREICDQVNTAPRPARQGHVSEQASDYEFPDDVGLWVGAKIVGETLWGKAYIYPNTTFHQMVVKRKAAGSTLSNSIWGKGRFTLNSDGTQRLSEFQLESIDFSPMERAALEALGGRFETTSEMKDKIGVTEMAANDNDADDKAVDIGKSVKEMAPHALHEMMTKEQRQHCAEMHIREMEPSAVYEMLPQTHRSGVHECYVKEFGQTMPAAEMAKANDLTQRVAQMEGVIAGYRQKEFDDALNAASGKPFSAWTLNSPSGIATVASAKENFKLMIVAQMAAMDGGAKLENIEAAATAAWPKYEPQAALLRTALSGGNVITGNQVSEQRQNNYGYDPKTGRYSDEFATAMRAVVAPK